MTSSCGLNESTHCPGICGSNFKCVIPEHILQIKLMNTCEIAPRWILLNTFDDQSSLIQVMAWCRQETSHCLIQFWSDLSHYMSSLGYNELTHWYSALLTSAYAVDTLCVTFIIRNHLSARVICLTNYVWRKHEKHICPISRNWDGKSSCQKSFLREDTDPSMLHATWYGHWCLGPFY